MSGKRNFSFDKPCREGRAWNRLSRAGTARTYRRGGHRHRKYLLATISDWFISSKTRPLHWEGGVEGNTIRRLICMPGDFHLWRRIWRMHYRSLLTSPTHELMKICWEREIIFHFTGIDLKYQPMSIMPHGEASCRQFISNSAGCQGGTKRAHIEMAKSLLRLNENLLMT